MKQKKKDSGPEVALPAVDESYVLALKIQTLQERNSALRHNLEETRSTLNERDEDCLDVMQHMQVQFGVCTFAQNTKRGALGDTG